MSLWKTIQAGWAQRAARVDSLEKRIETLESQIAMLSQNTLDLMTQLNDSASIGKQIGAHLASRPKFNWGP